LIGQIKITLKGDLIKAKDGFVPDSDQDGDPDGSFYAIEFFRDIYQP
jgi:hypothetical protein